MARTASDMLFRELVAAGIADDDTRRVLIDIQHGHAPVIYVERYGDERIAEVVRAVSKVDVAIVTPVSVEQREMRMENG